MKLRLSLLLTGVVFLALCHLGAEPPALPLGVSPTPDTMKRFHGVAYRVVGERLLFPRRQTAAFRSEDLAHPDFFNRFHFIFSSHLLSPINGEWYQVTCTAHADGTMTVAFGEEVIVFEPLDESIVGNMRKAAPGFETLWQKVTVTNLEHGQELLIEEPK